MDAREIELIVQQVLSNIDLNQISAAVNKNQNNSRVSKGDYGVFERVEDAIDAAYEAQKIYLDQCTLDDRNRIIEAIRKFPESMRRNWPE
jgi:propionaldehyde dehydrogenase